MFIRTYEGLHLDPAEMDDRVRSVGADGVVQYVVDSERLNDGERKSRFPVIKAVPEETDSLREAALELAACNALLAGSREIREDRVARRELSARAADAKLTLTNLLHELFHPMQPSVTWIADDGTNLARGRSMSYVLSEYCDRRYADSPAVMNEMIAVNELTSQGARARRDLIAAMTSTSALPLLAIEGYGPERAMYDAVLRHSGIHQPVDGERWSFGPPSEPTFVPVWEAIISALLDAHDAPMSVATLVSRLEAPPIGLKRALWPVLVIAALKALEGKVAVYQDGSYQPRITVEVVERLIAAPDRFGIKHLALDSPSRRRFLAALRESVRTPDADQPAHQFRPSPRHCFSAHTCKTFAPVRDAHAPAQPTRYVRA